jgi:hypothetical protein
MEVAHITVHSEAAVTKIADWCLDNDHNGVEFYVAPKLESSERNPAARIVVTASSEGLGILMRYIVANGLKTEWEVEAHE